MQYLQAVLADAEPLAAPEHHIQGKGVEDVVIEEARAREVGISGAHGAGIECVYEEERPCFVSEVPERLNVVPVAVGADHQLELAERRQKAAEKEKETEKKPKPAKKPQGPVVEVVGKRTEETEEEGEINDAN